MAKYIELSTVNVNVGTTTGEFLGAVDQRNYLLVQNNSAQTVFIKFGTAAATATDGYKLISGAEREFVEPGIGAIQAIALVAAVDISVTTNIET